MQYAFRYFTLFFLFAAFFFPFAAFANMALSIKILLHRHYKKSSVGP